MSLDIRLESKISGMVTKVPDGLLLQFLTTFVIQHRWELTHYPFNEGFFNTLAALLLNSAIIQIFFLLSASG